MKTSHFITGGLLAALLFLIPKGAKSGKVAQSLLIKHKGIKESDSRFYSTLRDIWMSAGLSQTKAEDYIVKNYAWSAAFISYVMIKAGFKDFPVSTNHACFASKIKSGNYSKYKLHRVGSYAPKVGDIVLLNRGGGKLTYDRFKCGDASHSDIVTSIGKGFIKTVGGNVSNQIYERTVKINTNGTINNSLYYAVIEVK